VVVFVAAIAVIATWMYRMFELELDGKSSLNDLSW
jgi:hypothetical protein